MKKLDVNAKINVAECFIFFVSIHNQKSGTVFDLKVRSVAGAI